RLNMNTYETTNALAQVFLGVSMLGENIAQLVKELKGSKALELIFGNCCGVIPIGSSFVHWRVLQHYCFFSHKGVYSNLQA
ncbi:uncharacterized, partial [Tachysurus ichikawai]